MWAEGGRPRPCPRPHPGRQAPHSLCSPHHVDMVHLGYSLPPTGLPQGHPLLGPPTSARSDPATPPSAKSASVAARIKLDPPGACRVATCPFPTRAHACVVCVGVHVPYKASTCCPPGADQSKDNVLTHQRKKGS